MVVTAKPNAGHIRIVVDTRSHKTVQHPIPTIEEAIFEMIEETCYSKPHLLSRYHQINLDKESREITAFSTPFDLRRHKRLSLEITSAFGHFQKALEE